MKKILFLLLSVFFSNAQIKTAVVNYGVTIGLDDLNLNNELKSSYQLAIENAKYLDFYLNANSKESSFISSNIINTQNQGTEFAKIFSGSKSSIYADNDNGFIYQEHDDVLGKYVLKKKMIKYEWNLTTETKTIEGFLCYKATTNDIVINSKGTFTFLITAWYCPQIPLSIGPIGIGGLPGLILELNRRNIVFGAKKIELNIPEETIKIYKPDFTKIRTEDEINKMKEEFLNNKD